MNKHRRILIMLILLSASARADDDALSHESYVSGLLGVGISTGSTSTSAFTFSGRIGTGFGDKNALFSFGLYVGNISNSIAMSGFTINGSTTLIAADLLARKAFGTGLYFGGRFGIGLENVGVQVTGSSTNSLSGSGTAFMVGPAAGYEFPLIPNLDLDLDISWITLGGTTVTFPGAASVNIASSSAFFLQGGLTYHW